MASWTARRCRRRRRGPMRRGAMKRRSERWRRGWPPCGPRCCRWSGVRGGAANVQDIYPLTPLQEGILFQHLMAAEGDPYLLARLLSFDSRERLEDFLQALEAVIGRHDILRTAVVWEGLREPVQVVWRRAPLVVEEVAPEEAGGDVAGQLRGRAERRQYRLDVRQAPLLRGVCVQDGGRWLLLLWSHHLAIDHTTLEVLQEEIQAHLRGAAGQLPAPLPFRNFVAQARLGVRPHAAGA